MGKGQLRRAGAPTFEGPVTYSFRSPHLWIYVSIFSVLVWLVGGRSAVGKNPRKHFFCYWLTIRFFFEPACPRVVDERNEFPSASTASNMGQKKDLFDPCCGDATRVFWAQNVKSPTGSDAARKIGMVRPALLLNPQPTAESTSVRIKKGPKKTAVPGRTG